MKFYKKFHSLSLSKKQFFNLAIFCVLVFSFFINFSSLASAATGVPKVINFQGRLMDSSGNLLGGPTGTNYCYRFSIYSATTGGTKLWPAGTPSTMTILTREGVFDAPVGDVSAGGDSLTYDFQTSDTTFMNVEVNTTPGTCSGTWESLSPRPQIVSAAYAINSGTVQGLAPTQSASGNQLPQLTSDALVLGGTSAGVKSTSTNALTFNAGASGDVQFFSSANKITSGGALTIAGLMTSAGLTSSAPVNVTSQSATALTVARTGTNYALQVDTNTASSVTGLKVTSAAAGGGLAISVISSGTDENLTIDAKGAGTISIGGNSTGDVLLAGGVGSTGCTITNSTGALSCTAGITASAIRLDQITAATTSDTDNDNLNNNISWAWSTATTQTPLTLTANGSTTGSILSLTSSSAAATTGQKGLNVALTGALTGAQTTYGGYFSNTRTGASAVNVGLYATASGATGGNYAAIFDAGNVGIGTAAPQAQLEITGNFRLADQQTDTNASNGIIYKDGTPFIHNFRHATGGGARPNGNNTFVGLSAGNLTMGSTATLAYQASNNSGFGYQAFTSNTTGYYNSAFGLQALYSNTTGYSNSAFGMYALKLNDTGYSNSAFGIYALERNTSGYYNAALGYFAGGVIADGSTSNQTSNTSVYLGSSTKALADGDTNEIVLGYNTTGFGSNTAAYGNSSITKHVFQTGNVGIGDTTPDQLLEILSSGAANTQFSIGNTNAGDYDVQIGFELSDGTNTFTMGVDDSDADKFKISTTALGTSDRFVIDSSGNVTIPDLGGGGTLCVQTDNNGTLSTTTCGGGGTWDTIGNPAADQNLTFDAGEETTWTINATTATNFAMNANALTSGTILSLTSNGTGALTGQKGLNISLSGANGTGAQTTYGAYISNTHTGASATSVGLYATASGGQTNYAAQFAGGIFQSGGFATFNIGSSVFGVASTTYPDYIFTVNDGVVAIGDWNGPDLNNTYLLVDDTNSIISANASSGFVFGGSNFELYSTTASGSGLLVSANSLTTGKGVSVESSSITSGALMDLTSTGTGALTGQKGLNISLSGTNGTGAQTTYGAYISNTKTGTSNNVGLYATASGGTNNYAAIFESGEVLIGSTTDLGTYKLQVTGDSYLNGTTTVAGNGANGQLSVFSPGGYYYPQISFYSNGSIGASLQGYNNALYAYTGGFYVSGGAVFNDSGADADFRIEGDTEQNLLFVDASTDRIGIGTATPVSQLTVKATDDGNATSYTHTPLNTALRFGTTDADTTSINNGAYISFGRHLGKGIMLYDNLNDGTIMGMGIAPYSMQSYLPPAGSYQFTWNVGYQSTLGTSELMRLTSAGELQIGSTTDLGPYRLQVTKADTGQTANASVSYLTNSGATFNTTSGALVSYGEYISSISTRSSGSNTLTNIGLYTTASGGQRNSGGVFEASYSAASSLQGNVGVSGNLIMTGNNAYASSGATGGVSGIVTLDSSADYTYTLGHIIAGVVATGYANGSGTTADKLAALKARTIVNNSAAVTDFYSVLVDSPDMSVSGTITNQYGVYIGDQKPSGVTNSFGIYQGGTSDINYFAGETRIGSTTDLGAYPLQVTGNAYVTSQIDFGSTGTGQGSLYKSGTAAILASTGTLQLSAGSGNRVQILVDNGARRAFYTTDGKFLFGGGSGETYGGIGSDNGTGALVFYYDDSSNSPNEAARFSSAGLFSTINNTITDTNSLFDLNLTLGNDATADTISALNIDVTSTATGADGDILYGINVANLTSADADVAESAIRVGTGWDNIFTSANASLTQAGALTVTSCTGCGGGVTADSLDFTDFSDTMTLDASTDINLGANAFTIDLDSTGDFSVRDGTTDFALFDDTGGITFAPNGTSDFTLTLDNDSSFIQNATVTDSGFIQDINLVLGDDAAIDTVTALNIDVTSSATGDADTLRGLTLSVSSADATVVEEGLVIGSGWDTDIRFLDTTPEMALADNGTLILSDGSSTTNDIFQIGTATSRGNALVYGDLVLKGGTITRNLTGIIDVFVYDTAGDSDSGDWRNSLEYLQRSWATETKDDGVGDACNIATDDRCGGAAFPRKAILVTTASALYIFDASDNSLWMKFTQSGTYALGADTNNNPSGVAAQNGVIVVGTNGSSATGMYAIDFKQDAMYRYNTTDRSQADNNIGNRNSTTTYSTNSETGFAIINNTVNDVSINMQTASMENRAGTLIAPVDSQGGPLLGVTLIAAATDSGVSVINMGTRKVVSYSDATNDDYNQVYITKRGRMYATNETRAQLEEWRGVDTVITAQTNGTPTRWYDETLAGNTPITLAGAVPTISTSPSALAVIERASAAREAAAAGQIDAGDVVFVGTDQGLAEVHTSGGTLANASWSKITTKDDATPYMNGGIRSVYLFDDAAGATSTNSAVGATGSTRNPMDTAGATSPTFGANGIRGGSVNFNNNSYLCSDADANGTCDSDTDNNVSTTSFTVSMWFKHGTTAAADVLFERCYTPATPTAATGCVFAGMNTTGNIVFGIDDDATWTTVGTVSMDDAITSSGTWNDNQWHHLLVTNTDTDICMYIDGRQAVACDTALAATATLDNAQVLTIGGRCTGANCVTGDSFWDGEIDEFTWSAGATTSSGSVASAANKRFLDGRTHLIRPQTSVTNADIGSSTTIGSSSQSYVPNSFAGLVVEITGGTGAGQTRNIISNTATTFTVYPAWSTTPDSTSDFRVSPSKLYGSTNTVTAIAVDAPTQINRVRNLYVGTNDGSDGGGVSVFTNAGAGGIKTEVYSSDSGIDNDDFGTAWSGTDADDINAIASFTDTIVFGTGTGLRSQRKDLSLKQMQADMFTAMDDIRSSLVASGLFGATQEVLGLGQGADLAEYYYSNTPLEAGDVVAIQPDQPAGIGKSTSKYQKNLLGVVSTKPGLTLGPTAENAYPIALSGRIPVKVTDENGIIKVGDLLTSSSRPGYAMRATSAGPIIGRVLNEPDYDQFTSCDAALPEIATTVGDGPGVTGVEPSTDIDQEIPEIVVSATGPKCGYVMLFAGLGESLGKNVEILAAEYGDLQSGQATIDGITTTLGTQSSIMSFLRASKADLLAKAIIPESIFSDRIAAGMEILTPTLYADDIYTKTITALDGGSVALIIGENGKFEVRKDESTPATITLDALGNAVFSGKVTAAEIDSAKITGFDALIERITALETLLQANAFDSLTSVTTQNLKATGDSSFEGKAQFAGLSFFSNTTTFDGGVVFGAPVEFNLPPIFNKDTAGFAIIKEGARKVEVVFNQPYIAQPVTSASISLEDIIVPATEVEPESIQALSDSDAQAFLDQGISYIITNKTTKGFTIRINKNAPRDIRFSWTAFAVKDPSIFESIVDGLIINPPVEENTPPEVEEGGGNSEGEEENPPIDICPNIEGEQTVMLEGYQVDIDGNCTTITQEGGGEEDPAPIPEEPDPIPDTTPEPTPTIIEPPSDQEGAPTV